MIDSIHVIAGCVSLGILWFFWYYGWKAHFLDRSRQQMFAIRDELFNLALAQKHGLTFESHVYGSLRASINANIRFAHRVSFSTLTLVNLSSLLKPEVREQMKHYKTPAIMAIEALDNPELKADLEGLQKKVFAVQIEHVIFTSPILVAYLMVAVIAVLISLLVHRGIYGSMRSLLRRVREEIRVTKLEPQTSAVRFQTAVMEMEEACAA